MGRRISLTTWIATAALAWTTLSAAAAAERVALLIGNGAYQHSTELLSPIEDVRRLAVTLRERLGFEVQVETNLDERSLELALIRFNRTAAGADTALVYYSGHGMEISGTNYLIPIDAALRQPGDELAEAVPLRLALRAVAGAKRLSAVIIDACRNGAPGATMSGVSKGYLPVEADRPGLVIAFSTAPGEPAWSGAGAGDLSPYTQALTERLSADPNTDVRFLFTSLARAPLSWPELNSAPSLASATCPNHNPARRPCAHRHRFNRPRRRAPASPAMAAK